MRAATLAPALAGVLALAACSSGADAPVATSSGPRASASSASPQPSATSTPSPTASPVDSATPDVSSASPSASASPTAAVRDYGATLAVWATRHHEDERFDPGAMWDPTPGWGPDDAHDDVVNDLVTTGGRVLRYDMSVPRPSVPAERAIAIATATLPKDAVVLWRKQFAACYVVQLTSRALGSVLAGAPFANPDGHVELQLRSGSPTDATAAFDPARVTSVLVRPTIAATPADFPGC